MLQQKFRQADTTGQRKERDSLRAAAGQLRKEARASAGSSGAGFCWAGRLLGASEVRTGTPAGGRRGQGWREAYGPAGVLLRNQARGLLRVRGMEGGVRRWRSTRSGGAAAELHGRATQLVGVHRTGGGYRGGRHVRGDRGGGRPARMRRREIWRTGWSRRTGQLRRLSPVHGPAGRRRRNPSPSTLNPKLPRLALLAMSADEKGGTHLSA
jgi:hypothetical protein